MKQLKLVYALREISVKRRLPILPNIRMRKTPRRIDPTLPGKIIMQKSTLTGRIANLAIFSLVEFGARARFKIECGALFPIVCAVEGNVAREFIAHYCEGDMVAVTGVDEPRPSTAAANTPWLGRFRVRAERVAEDARLAA